MDFFKAKESFDPVLTRLASFTDMGPAPVIEVSLDGAVTYINPAAWKLFPGIRDDGLDHPYLEGIAEIATQLRDSGKMCFERDIQTDDLWYRQILCFIKTERRMRIYGFDITGRKHVEEKRERLIADLQASLARAIKVGGVIPICLFCKKIKNQEGIWHHIETFISDHSDANVSHGLCPDCLRVNYPDFSDKVVGR